MAAGEKRESLRVLCDYPVRVYGQLREFSGKMVDISRTGSAIEIPVARLLADGDVGLAAVAGAVEKLLGGHFLADLHSEMLGPLVRKRLRPVRLGQVDGLDGGLEIGCVFEEPLTDDEATMLGIGLPPVGVTAVAEFRDVPAPTRRKSDGVEPAKPRPTGHECFIHPPEGSFVKPLVGRTDGVTDGTMLFRLSLADMPVTAEIEIAPLTAYMAGSYGATPRVEILDGLHMVWAGTAEIQTIEITGRREGEMHVTLRALSED